MRILCLGDVVGAPGREAIGRLLPGYRDSAALDFVVANIENVVEGAGINASSYRAVRMAGVDVCTSGDHVYKRSEVLKLFVRDPDRILRPVNYPANAAGRGMAVVAAANGIEVAVVNVQGRVFMDPCDDPFRALDQALETIRAPVVIVDVHAEATSEKRAIGWYLDGRVSAVVGTHTHVPTADEEVLPGGTAYVTDLGMCGPYRSVIGRNTENVLKSFTTRMYAPFSVAREDVRLCGVIVEVDGATGRASSIERVVLRN